jgi:hypothetical protein
VSAATLSRFERAVATPRDWFVEWMDDFGMWRNAIIAKPLAAALGFADVRELHDFCMAGDVSRFAVDGDRRSGLWLPSDCADPGVPSMTAFPTDEELRVARFRSGRSKT